MTSTSVRRPSGRNHALYRAYKIDGRSQTELAAEFGLTQGRVSQIIRRFEEWRAIGAPTGTCDSLGKPQSAARSHDENLRVERWIEKERAEAIFVRAIRAFDRASTSLVTTVEHFNVGQRGPSLTSATIPPATRENEAPVEPATPNTPSENRKLNTENLPSPSRLIRTTRQVAPPAHFLRLARQASNDLGRLADKEPPKEAQLEPTDQQRLEAIREHLSHFRCQAEANHEVATSEYPRDTVNYWLAALLGDRDIWIDPADLAPGSPLQELLNFFSPNRDDSNPEGDLQEGNPLEGEAPAEPADDSATSASTWDSPSSLKTENRKPKTPTPNTPENPALSTPQPSNASNKPNTSIAPSPLPTLDLGQGTLNSPLSRRLAHQRKLAELAEFRRRGLPHMIHFDPADGPLPPTYHQLDSADPTNGYSIVEPGNY